MDIDEALHSEDGYPLGHAALRGLQDVSVWPTVLNYELWLHLLSDPNGTLALEIKGLLAAGEPITDALAEDLGRAYLPKAKLEAEISEAGSVLSEELGAVAEVIAQVRGSTGQYGAELERAGARLGGGRMDQRELNSLVSDLADSTEKARNENAALEHRLGESSVELKKLREALAQARQAAATDGLSNLANRRAFDDELARACATADADGRPLSLAMLDIDHFKTINDTWGHQTGDQVIRYVASVISRVGAPPRFAARFGGDEFAILFATETGAEVSALLNAAIREVAARRLNRRTTNEPLGEITMSAGFAARRPQEAPAALLGRADQALYASKGAGRNRVTAAAEPERPRPVLAGLRMPSLGPLGVHRKATGRR